MKQANKKVIKEIDLKWFVGRRRVLKTALSVLLSENQMQIIKSLSKVKLTDTKKSACNSSSSSDYHETFHTGIKLSDLNQKSDDKVQNRIASLIRSKTFSSPTSPSKTLQLEQIRRQEDKIYPL